MAKTKMRPLGARLIVKPVEVKEEVRSGIILAKLHKERPQEGVVIAVGPGRCTDAGTVLPMNVVVGDTVLYGKYAGSDTKIDDVEHIILMEDDVIAVMDEE